ncbi:MAG: tRNA 2-thiouridine(34) synthase MnmA, partial [Candidatus Azambacteria bacterium]|nr:tRNA 2-thiouridine(34) synthase MnmA [Candidatus Azambacteria bacterium]
MKTGKNKNKKFPRVVVAMSGGVDSSVSAALLKKAGFDVVGIFMKFWLAPRGGVPFGSEVGKEYNRCCSAESEKLARLVAKQIGIPFYVLNVEKEFKKAVVDYFLSEYKKGNTP